MPANFTYRLATIDDVEGIQHVLSTTWQATYPYLKPETIQAVKAKWHSPEFLSKQIENEKYFFPIAAEENQIVGIATSGMRVEGKIDLFRFYVLPDFQGQGIGRYLLKMVEDNYPAAQKIHLYVDEGNQAGFDYYERRGFKKVRKEEGATFGEIMTQWLMEKNISET